MSEELRKACFEVARCVKWSRKPVDADEISELASKFYEIAKDQESTVGLEIDYRLSLEQSVISGQYMPPSDGR